MKMACQVFEYLGGLSELRIFMVLIQYFVNLKLPGPTRCVLIFKGLRTPVAVQVCKPRIAIFPKNRLF
jgi:hypothetical protein